MGPVLAQAIVGIGKAVQAGNAIKGTAKNVSNNLKKWYKPAKTKKSHFKKAGSKTTKPAQPQPTIKPVPTVQK